MIIKLGSNISEMSGSISGHTIQKSQGGFQVRKKPCSKKQPTQAQQFIRSIHSYLLSAWSQLPQNAQILWNTFAKSKEFRGKFGDKIILSGQALFLKYQFEYAFNNLPLISSPFDYHKDPYGPELITNGNFNGILPWTFTPAWEYHLGYALFVDSFSSYFRQNLILTNSLNYKVDFTILTPANPLRFAFYAFTGNPVFSGQLSVLTEYMPGQYSFTVQCIFTTNGLRVYGSTGGSQGSITNISIRQLIT